MKQLNQVSVATVAFFFLSPSFAGPPPSVLEINDASEVIGLYHSLPNSSKINPDYVVSTMSGEYPGGLGEIARQAKMEQDAFKKDELIGKLLQDPRISPQWDETPKKTSIFTSVMIEPYRISEKTFKLCWGYRPNCDSSVGGSLRFRYGNYEIAVKVPGWLSFSAEEGLARTIEQEAGRRGQRMLLARLVLTLENAIPLQNKTGMPTYSVGSQLSQVVLMGAPGKPPGNHADMQPLMTLEVSK